MITGDALVTVNLNSLWGFLLWGVRRNKQILSGPPWYTTWNWRAAKESVTSVARVQPRVLATGHGLPMTGPTTARDVRAFADNIRLCPKECVKTGADNGDGQRVVLKKGKVGGWKKAWIERDFLMKGVLKKFLRLMAVLTPYR